MKITKYTKILDYLKAHEGKATTFELQYVAMTTSIHKYLQNLRDREIIRTEGIPGKNYCIHYLL